MNIAVNDLIKALPSSCGKLTLVYQKKLTTFTMPQLNIMVLDTAKRLKSQGITANTKVAVYSENSLDYILVDLALICLGAIHAAVDNNLDLEYVCAALKITHIIHFNEQSALPDNCQAIFFYKLFSDSAQWGCLNSDKQDEAVATELAPYQFSESEPLAIKFTSGSTQEPKAMYASVAGVSDSIVQVQSLFSHCPNDKILLYLPLQLIQQRYWIYSAILFGFQVIVSTPLQVYRMIQIVNPTVIMGVPDFYQNLLNYVSQNNTSLHNVLGKYIRYLWTGSAPLADETAKHYQKAGYPLLQGFGMNEVCIVSKNTLEDNRPGSCGKVLNNKIVEIADNGEILVKAKFPVCHEYLLPKGTAVVNSTGYVKTGDLGHLDKDGFLFIDGRIKDEIILASGRTVHPRPIEQQIENASSIPLCIISGENQVSLVALIFITSRHSEDQIRTQVSIVNREFKSTDRIQQLHFINDTELHTHGLLSNQGKPKRQKILQRYAPLLRNTK